MKKLIVLGLILLGSLLIRDNASAWSFGTPGSASILDSIVNNPGSTATKHDATGTGTTRVDSATISGRVRINYSPGGSGNEGYVQELSVKTGLNIPANSIGRLNFIIEGNSDTIIDVNPFNLRGDDILQQNCDVLASKRDSNNLEKPTKLYCSVLIYKITRGTTIDFASNLFGFTNSGFKIFLPTAYNWIEITDDSGGSGSIDVAQIKTDVQSILAQAQNSNLLLNDIKTLLNQVKTQGQAQQETLEAAMQNAREEEKEEYEEQQDDVSGGADDAGEEAEAATSSLIDAGRDIIETIRDTPATNCVIRIKRGNFDTGNLNLCNVPQQIRTMISTAIVIPVTLAALHIAYSVVMLYLNTVRKEQE